MANTFFTGGMEAIDAGQVEQIITQTRTEQGGADREIRALESAVSLSRKLFLDKKIKW